MNTLSYPAFFFRQRKTAPLICTFVATSADVFDWASTPVKTDKNIRNFQRPEIKDHVDEISEFFANHPNNSSPSSIVVGFRTPPQCFEPDGTTPLDLASIPEGTVVEGKIAIQHPKAPPTATGEKRTALSALLAKEKESVLLDIKKLEAEGVLPAEEEGSSAEGSTDDEASAPEEADEEDTEVKPNEVDEPGVLASKKTYLETLNAIDPATLEKDDLDEWLGALIELRKPALIIDGQHRVRGTKSKKILFPISALPDAPWPELAFQFIVLNKAARKVPDSLLINIVGNSLTVEERQLIEKRLNDSGVPVPLYQGVMMLHGDPESPFRGKLRFGIKNEKGIIDAASAKTKIVHFWFSCRMYRLVSHLIPGKAKAEKIQTWQSTNQWYDFLKAFWGAARETYEHSSTLWGDELEPDGKTPQSRLMRVTVINLTQVAMVEHMTTLYQSEIANDVDGKLSMADKVPSLAEFRKVVKFYFERLKPEAFTEWGPVGKGLDGSVASRDAYKDMVKLVISGTPIPDLKKGNKKKGIQVHPLYMQAGAAETKK